MPRMDQAPAEQRLAKLLIIGEKLGKSTFAGMAALAGFNVLYLDADVGRQTLATLPKQAQERIYVLDVGDIVDGGKDSRFYDTMKEFTSVSRFVWNDTQSKLSTRKGDQPGDKIWEIKPGRLDESVVLVIDSWTSYVESLWQAIANAESIDLAEATTAQMRPLYGTAGFKATQLLQMIRSIKCHVICIGHPDEYTHLTKKEGSRVGDAKAQNDAVIDWTRMIAKSTSKPHGMLMPKYFSDVAWIDTNAAGTERRLDFRVSDQRVGGGHFTGRDTVENYSFANLVKQLGGTVPTSTPDTSKWLTISTVGEAAAPTAESKVLDGTQPTTTVKPAGGMAGLLQKKAG